MYISSSQNRAFGDGVNRKDMAQIGEDFYKAIEAKVHGRREGTDPTSGFLSRRITGSLHVDHLRHDLFNADFADWVRAGNSRQVKPPFSNNADHVLIPNESLPNI